MAALALVPIGHLPRGFPDLLLERLSRETRMSCRVMDTVLDPSAAYDPRRGQYNCRELLPMLDAVSRDGDTRVLGVADVDLFSPIFTFVLGEAHLGGQAGLFSLRRLDPAYYGLPEDTDLLWRRAEREALHETGHLLGLEHCARPDCVMRFSASAEEVDLKPAEFCPDCAEAAHGAD